MELRAEWYPVEKKTILRNRMQTCRVCGEDKPLGQFTHIPYFCKYKKHKVVWCHECQKMYMKMKKEKQRVEAFLQDDQKFIVSFE